MKDEALEPVARARICPPCNGNCQQGDACPASRWALESIRRRIAWLIVAAAVVVPWGCFLVLLVFA